MYVDQSTLKEATTTLTGFELADLSFEFTGAMLFQLSYLNHHIYLEIYHLYIQSLVRSDYTKEKTLK